MMLYGLLMLLTGILGTEAVHQLLAIHRADVRHENYVREWKRVHQPAPRTTCIVRTRHRRAARHEYPAPLPLDDITAQLVATGKARCVRIGGVYR